MKNKIKYFLSLTAMLALFIFVGELVMAEQPNKVIVDEMEIIDAEEIGIETIKNETKEVAIHEEIKAEDKNVYETPVSKEEIPVKSVEENKSKEVEEVEYDSPEAEPLMFEGYQEGIYFEPNCFDCELHEYCYKCEEHEIEIEYFWDEEINPNEGWVRSETCIICGHGGCEPITEEEIE